MRLSYQARQGELWLWGDRDRLEHGGPVVLVLPGVFARRDTPWFRLGKQLPEAAVLVGGLPGQSCPALSETSVEAWAEAYGELLQNMLGGRPVLVVGESLGGTIALAIPNPGIRRLVLDPVLKTNALGSLRAVFARAYIETPGHRQMMKRVFGFDGERFELRDYTGYVGKPGVRYVLGGELPFPERDLPPIPGSKTPLPPSVVDVPEREFLRSTHSHVTVVGGLGHVMVWWGDLLMSLIRQELQKLEQDWAGRSPHWTDAAP